MSDLVLGHLTLRHLSFGMILFTPVMCADIYMFSGKMRTHYVHGAFNWQGKAVLILLCLLICTGWFLVA